ncbi:ABC transporter ATP-binding protein [Microbacterium sp. MPKO10]|uniref:ABC transporter ATP-binding protein n=1 Tax=Microbacterium sp. MPKO10 TaxID=2989818 RepID=UPI0022354513|nr:ABC transporter ATP-binding protein [Microbacterium sp. MPKO10]MCW4457641.1 ABC transporter ATP-binding protein/permease [Microbacterium sp. MPKO10]
MSGIQATRKSNLNTVQAIWRIYPFAKHALPRISLGMIAALLGSVVALLIPMVLEKLVNGALAQRDPAEIWPAVAIVLGLGVVEAAMIALRRWFVLLPGTTVEAKMRNEIYRRLQDLPVAFHDRWPSGQLLSRMMQDLNMIRRWLSFGIVLLVVNVLTIVIGSVILFTWHWLLGTIFLVCAIPVWIYGYMFEKKYSIVARRSQDQAGDLATNVEEAVHGIRVLKAFGRGKHALEGFSVRAEGLRGVEIEKAKAIAGIWYWLILLPDIGFGLCLVAGIWLASQGQINVGELFAFFATAIVLRFPIESIGFLLSMTFDTRTAVDRVFEVLDEVNTITDPEHPETIESPQGRLEFDDVHFRFADSPERYPDLINGVNLVIEPGETMALVGLTGCGKTTLTSLTTRIYDVTGGAVRLDGVAVQNLTRGELRRNIAMAFEDATLFSASVRENVLLGREELDLDSDEAQRVLDEAIGVAQAQFVHDLPNGVDTTVGEEGLSLSGGQRQRLALARAVAAAPSVLVLDDPLSALDVDTEALVEAALRRVLASTTALIVAHRPSTVALADRVALMQDGRITDVGTHTELLGRNEHYRFVISSLEDEEKREREEALQ